ncbi:hypothetical protein PV08_06005 [Exophiala spinifera]|uniref:CID domain-containing protein n=1 Tax=Exophiala spinifera TaxID=91928 RepID=A0A0D2BBJ1_9EURO|nr:uncharacterized protein PV08_06005 [Exophiala spinifera]KIW15955.1 hypothetical protein PV08_06005 [Exophiala spinifera]
MADPFEVRMRFTNLLTHLSASATASIKTAHYALKHRDMDEDLHSCIIENLERGNNMNNRANIMYFLEHHADINTKEGGHGAYVDMIRRDIQRIVDAVAQSGANVKVVRRVVMGLSDKGVLSAQVTAGIETGLKEKEDKMGKLLGDDDKPEDSGTPTQVDEGHKPTPRGKGSVSKMDKRAIEQRIEEDRERNKRLRESVWAVSGDDDQELDRLWEEGSSISEDERVIADEEAEERLQFVRYYKSTMVGS